MFDIVVVECEVRELHMLMSEAGSVRFGDPGCKYTDEKELIDLIGDADAVVCTARGKFTRNVIASAKNLKIIAKCGSVPNNIDLEAATEYGVAVTYTPGANMVSVAEHALTLMMALLKLMPKSTEIQKSGGWKSEALQASELTGKTVGIIGFGAAGSSLAEMLKPFNADLLCFDPYADPEKIARAGAKSVDMDTLLRHSDVISLHCQLCDETRGFIDRKKLQKMKKSAYLVNTARGALVDEEALAEALREKCIAGAGIDVYSMEPTSADNPLLALDNVLCTPHLAGWTKECLARETQGTTDSVIQILKGQIPDNLLNQGYLKNLKKQ
ncbi:MAG: hydroxyacid dehydrogenase [Synergistaceae bacterium]|nr:hydroxyacid dehydrogenase [Synergistaceae bacterium]